MLNLVLIGMNHRTSGVDTRERAAFRTEGIPDALRALAGRQGINEAMILSTCNRVELLTRVESHEGGIHSLETFLSEVSGLAPDQLQGTLYRHTDEEVVRHVFRVASSLDSMILGEPQILGQLKSFYETAVSAQTVGPCLNALLQASFRAAKRVRTETNLGDYSVSVSSAAVELARKIFGSLQERSIFIIGAGKMGELAVRHLASSGAGLIRVANRNSRAAQALAGRFRGKEVAFEELGRWIARSDIIITSTGAPDILVSRATIQSVMGERKNAPIVFIDISVPRNVDPGVGTLDNVYYYDVDDLGNVVDANLQERKKEAIVAERIVEQEVEHACAHLRSLEAAPIVSELQDRIQEICRAELDRFLRKAGPRSAEEAKELEGMVLRIAAKIAHPLITQARLSHRDAGDQTDYVDTIRRIFKLQKNIGT